MLGQILEAYTSYQRRVIQEEIQNTISQDEQVQRTEPVAEIPQPVLSSPAPVTYVQPAPVPQEEILRVVAAFSQAENQSWFSKMCLVSGAIAGFFLHAAHVGRLPFRVGAVPIGASGLFSPHIQILRSFINMIYVSCLYDVFVE